MNMKPMSKEAQEALEKLTPESRAKVMAAVQKASKLILERHAKDRP